MRQSFRLVLLLLGIIHFPASAAAHFHMLLPKAASIKKGEEMTILFQWGHPFEHQLFDAVAPERVTLRGPDGKAIKLPRKLEEITVPATDQKEVTAFQIRYTPQIRGDFVFVVKCPPIWMEEDQEFFEDTVKVVVHVQAQKGWDAVNGDRFEWVPLTRPYGLQPGTVFQAQALAEGKPVPGALVEIERYHPTVRKEEDLPPEEQRTLTAKTDPQGVVTYTLSEPGWWCITAQRLQGTREHQGKAYPVKQRATHWIYVDEKPAVKAGR